MNEIYTLLFLTILTAFFVWLHYYKKFQLDSYRQDVFKLRDDLFIYAAQGNISFNHDAYKMARTYLNGSIRFAERSSLLRMVIMKLEFKHHKPHFQNEFNKKLIGLSNEQKNKITKVLDSTVNRTLIYIGDKNVLLVSAYHLIRYIRFLKSSLNSLRKSLKLEYKNIYSDAVYNEGNIKYS